MAEFINLINRIAAFLLADLSMAVASSTCLPLTRAMACLAFLGEILKYLAIAFDIILSFT
jgi:hypothetical protein